MLPVKILIYVATVALAVYVAYLFWKNVVEKMIYFVCVAQGQVPLVPSDKRLRAAVVREISAHYPNMKTACEAGSGYGGLARKIARECGVRVTALEKTTVAALVSKIADIITRSNSRTVWRDAFEYIEESDGFDIAVAYMGPEATRRLAGMKGKFRVLITLDFPVAGLAAKRAIDLKNGWTRYGRKKYPHKLFIYEL